MEILQIILAVVLCANLSIITMNLHKLNRLINKDDERIMRYVEYVVKQLKENKKPKPFSKWEQ